MSGKRLYDSELLAEDALIEAHIRFEYRANNGPVNVYRCDECGYFHLTSRGAMNARLQEFIQSGNLKKHKLANHWDKKLKNR